MLNMNNETFLACEAEFDEAQVVLYGAPFDSTTSFRPGSRFGSGAIRHESYGLESYSPYQDKDLTDYAVMDSGDIELPMGDSAAALDAINKFYPIMGMPMVPSQYWNMVHGIAPQDVLKDEEGLQIMRNLGVKMAWMLRSIQAGRQAGVPAPVLEEPPLRTNFIR